jgi:HEAT repeat protein
VVPILVHFLKDDDWAVKARAAHALGKTKDPRAFEPLLKVFRFRRGRNNACTSAATALGELGDPRAAKILIKALKHPIPEIRRSVASGLIKLNAPEALPHLLERIDDPDKTVRNNVAFAIAEYEDPSTFNVLREALEEETENSIKYAYVKGIEKCGHPESVPYLCGLLLDPSEEVKRSAAFALSSLKDSRAIPAFREALGEVSDPEIKQMYSHFLKRLEKDAEIGSRESIDDETEQ